MDILNTLDGFSLQPRLSIPFDGTIDVNSVTSDSVYLVSIGDTRRPPIRQQIRRIGINRVLWDPATLTLFAEPDEILEQHTRYAIVVSGEVRDSGGNPIEPSARCPNTFTTQSVTATLEKIRDQIKSSVPKRADFLLSPRGTRTVFPYDQIQAITVSQQTGANPPQFTAAAVPLANLNVISGVVGQIAFGKYLSPDYMVHPGEFIPAVATRTGVPQVRSMNEIYFNLYLPSGQKPVTGWPVAIFTHSANGSKEGGRNIAASLAAHGIATIIINHVGHGGGPLTTLTVTTKNGAATTFSASGRGIDQNGDRVIGAREGDTAASPRTLSQDTDGIRQTVADLMQLVRVIEIGMDIDGDGRIDLDRGRIYSVGASLGGLTSMIFMAVEPDVRAAVFMSPGGPVVENLRLSPVQRTPSIGAYLASRSPSLINAPGMTSVGGVAVAAPFFNENKPLKNQPPVINTVGGAIAIQTVLDRMEWVSQPGNYVGYVRHLRKDPLEGVPAKSILLHFGKGDQGTPNVNTSEILLTGDLADRALFYRHDVAFADNPTLPKDSHLFSLGFRGGNLTAPPIAAIALPAQEQIAIFFESHGSIMNQPQPVRYFESPVSLPLPDGLSYIP